MELTDKDRQELEEQLGKVSDRRWGILVSEVATTEDYDEAVEIIIDVVRNFDDYEKEYDDWESRK